MSTSGIQWRRHVLFGSDGLELNSGVIVDTAACRTQAVHIGLDVVVAELAYLAWRVS